MVTKHPILRTDFYLEADAYPLQIVRKHVEARIGLDDLTGLSGNDQDDFVKRWHLSFRTIRKSMKLTGSLRNRVFRSRIFKCSSIPIIR